MSTILIPDVITLDEMERIAEFVSSVDEDIPFHVTSYIPVPGIPWRTPSQEEIKAAVSVVCQHLKNVTCSSLTVQDYLSMTKQNSLHRKTEVD